LVEKFNVPQSPAESYLSDSSVDDEDFDILKSDNFTPFNEDVPAYDPNI
jgi:hypothetical protein